MTSAYRASAGMPYAEQHYWDRKVARALQPSNNEVRSYSRHQTQQYQPHQYHEQQQQASIPQQQQYHEPHYHDSQQPIQQHQPHDLQARPQRGGVVTSPSISASNSLMANSPRSDVTRGSRSLDESDSLVYHSMKIPKRISPAGGNLAEFAAQMTCLFWFESIDDLKRAESINKLSPGAPIPRLPDLARPFEQFQKWVYNVLSTTQVTQNVILLGLLFIYRLKMSTPQIKGRAGSEYRLLSVALMLGNKFLDDNTYTNKTWAEVSSFAVQEIHVMEVEFLSNMRYNLLVTSEQWEEWLDKLVCFREYYERALALPASPVHVASPVPSPTRTMKPNLPSLPVTPTHTQNWSAYQANAVSPLASKPALGFPTVRKRSPDEDLAGHPAKRPNPAPAVAVPVVAVRPNAPGEAARLPLPHLVLDTEQARNATAAPAYATPNGYPTAPPQVMPGISLPPLQRGVRAMATVYQPSPVTMVQQPSLPTVATSVPPGTFPSDFATPTKHHSPNILANFNSSPLGQHFANQGTGIPTPMAHTPISNSPIVYLQQRPSPYKPVRHVNTLLYPPPSASLDQYHLAVPLQPTQMHYQPLGRPNDLRTGILPEFLVYNRGGQPHQGLGQQGHQGQYSS